jgi:hypothetical protein
MHKLLEMFYLSVPIELYSKQKSKAVPLCTLKVVGEEEI